MLISVEAEIFLSPARFLVNPVNGAGVMSSGDSAEFKRFFPEAFTHYRSLCESGQLEPGRLFIHRAAHRTIIHLPIRRHWRTPATVHTLEAGLQKLADSWADLRIPSLAIPRFADGLDWQTGVRPLLETYLAPLPIPVYLHQPAASDRRRNIRQIDQYLNVPARPVSFDRFWLDLGRQIRQVRGQFSTGDGRKFTLAQENGARYSRLAIKPAGETAIGVPQTLLVDLWAMLHVARLLVPAQFPGGLEPLAPYLLPAMARLNYVRVVNASIGDAQPAPALLFLPPPDDAPRQRHAIWEATA